MNEKQVKLLIRAIRIELHNKIAYFKGLINNWEAEIEHYQYKLMHHQRINDNTLFRNSQIIRLESRLEKLENRIESCQQKGEKIEGCIEHLPQLKALISRRISTSRLSYDFKQYYLPEYKKIVDYLKTYPSNEYELHQLELLPETIIVTLPERIETRQPKGR